MLLFDRVELFELLLFDFLVLLLGLLLALLTLLVACLQPGFKSLGRSTRPSACRHTCRRAANSGPDNAQPPLTARKIVRLDVLVTVRILMNALARRAADCIAELVNDSCQSSRAARV